MKLIKKYLWLISLIILSIFAFLLRYNRTAWGCFNPTVFHYFSYHPDEIFLLLPSFYFAQGDWNPYFYNYGTLYIYLVGIPAVLLHYVPDPSEFPSNLWMLYRLGRGISVTLGTATIILLALTFLREKRGTGLLAAFLLSVCPLHLVNSAYATVDVPATFFLTLAFFLTLRGLNNPGWKRGMLAGIAVGLAAATKYNASLFLIPALLCPQLVPPRSWRWSWCFAMIGGAILGFVIGCPYFWTPEFKRDFLFELHHARVGGTLAFVGTGNGWSYHLLHGLPVGLGYPLLAAVLIGMVATIRLSDRASRLSLLWIVLYLAVIGFGKERFIRYLVPLMPFFCFLAAYGLIWLLNSSKFLAGRLVTRFVVIVVIFSTFLQAVVMHISLSYEDPRNRAAQEHSYQISSHVGLVDVPWFWHPPISPYNAGPFSRPWFEDWNKRNGYPVIVTGWDVGRLEVEKPEVFFLSDLESQDLLRLKNPEAIAFMHGLNSIYKKRRVFARPEPFSSWLAPPRSWAPPDWLYQSPVITMYYNPK